MGVGRWVLGKRRHRLGRWRTRGGGFGGLARLRKGLVTRSQDRRAAKQIRTACPARGTCDSPDVEVHGAGDDDERWVCGSFAVWGEDGSLGPYRDFWVTVIRVPDTVAEIREVRANDFLRAGRLPRPELRPFPRLLRQRRARLRSAALAPTCTAASQYAQRQRRPREPERLEAGAGDGNRTHDIQLGKLISLMCCRERRRYTRPL